MKCAMMTRIVATKRIHRRCWITVRSGMDRSTWELAELQVLLLALVRDQICPNTNVKPMDLDLVAHPRLFDLCVERAMRTVSERYRFLGGVGINHTLSPAMTLGSDIDSDSDNINTNTSIVRQLHTCVLTSTILFKRKK